MKKAKTKGKTNRKFVDLYKVFKKSSTGENIGPWAGGFYFRGANSVRPMGASCQDFVSQRITQPLAFCSFGYHAFPASAKDYYLHSKRDARRFRLYKVRLYNATVMEPGSSTEKWVGTHFKVLQRVTSDLKPRRFKD